MKTITVIDAFISNDSQKILLNNFLLTINQINPILLITNSIIDKSVIDKVDYLIYDKNNNLFESTYNNYEKFILWKRINNLKFNSVHYHTQKHGLSVLINLFRSLKFAKELGYTHFRRIEYDTVLGGKSINDIISTPLDCFNNNKKAKFYINEKGYHSFQYFFSEIDFFLNNFPEIKNENDYVNLIQKEFNSLDFVIVEKLMSYYINKLNKDEIYLKNDLASELNDSIWNQSLSNSGTIKQMQGCSTELYKQGDKNLIFTLNKQNIPLYRKVIIYYHNNNPDVFEYNCKNEGEWFLNDIKEDVYKIEIYDNNILTLKQSVTKIENYIEVL